MAKYKKVEVDEEVCSFKEVSNVEVEDEVIDAMKEGQAKILELEAENARLLAEVERVRRGPETSPLGVPFINQLRETDIPGMNRTCKCCSRRVPLHEMHDGVVEFCKTCARM